MVKDYEDFYAVCDSMVLCRFVAYPIMGPILWDDLASLYSIVTDSNITKTDLVQTGERIHNLCRYYNLREGMNKHDDRLPDLFMNVPLKKGQYNGITVSKENFEKMLNKYYTLRKWDNNGIPPKDSI
jgi:aldehyde:ferredoxin oxidoreductase